MNYGYLRVSGFGQIDGTGLERQRASVEAKAKAMGWILVEVHAELAVTDTTEGSARPVWANLVSDCKPGDRIVIEKLDRFARELIVQEVMVADLAKRGIELVSALEPDVASDDPTRVLYRQIMGAIAQYDRSMIVAKLRYARQLLRARNGKCKGRPNYGVTPEELAVVDRMQVLRSEGLPYHRIAAVLNEEGIQSRYGKLWNQGGVHKILSR